MRRRRLRVRQPLAVSRSGNSCLSGTWWTGGMGDGLLAPAAAGRSGRPGQHHVRAVRSERAHCRLHTQMLRGARQSRGSEAAPEHARGVEQIGAIPRAHIQCEFLPAHSCHRISVDANRACTFGDGTRPKVSRTGRLSVHARW